MRLGNVQGLWYSVETESYVRNNSDGTYEVAEDRLGLDSNAFLQGRFELDGDTLTLISSAASQVCNEGDIGHYRIEILDAGHNRTSLIDDECEGVHRATHRCLPDRCPCCRDCFHGRL